MVGSDTCNAKLLGANSPIQNRYSMLVPASGDSELAGCHLARGRPSHAVKSLQREAREERGAVDGDGGTKTSEPSSASTSDCLKSERTREHNSPGTASFLSTRTSSGSPVAWKSVTAGWTRVRTATGGAVGRLGDACAGWYRGFRRIWPCKESLGSSCTVSYRRAERCAGPIVGAVRGSAPCVLDGLRGRHLEDAG